MTEITTVKQRFGIIGTSPLLDRALELCGVLGMGGRCTRGFGRVRFLGGA